MTNGMKLTLYNLSKIDYEIPIKVTVTYDQELNAYNFKFFMLGTWFRVLRIRDNRIEIRDITYPKLYKKEILKVARTLQNKFHLEGFVLEPVIGVSIGTKDVMGHPKKDNVKKLTKLPTMGRTYIHKPCPIMAVQANEPYIIETLEGDMKANKGDYIVQGTAGELYPVKKEIFATLYEVDKDG